MLRKFIAKNISLPLFDYAKGLKVRKYYKFYKETPKWNRKEIEEYQFQKLKELIKYAYENVPFYMNRLQESNLTPDSIKSFNDIRKIPPLTRDDLQKNINILVCKKADKNKLFKSSSSGTTGIPVIYFKDINAESADIAAGYLQWNISGWNLGEKRLHIWGNPESIKKWDNIFSKIKRRLFSYKNFPSFLLNNEDNYLKIINLINKFKPSYIDGYANSVYMLAKFVMDNKVKTHVPKKIFTTAENLYDYQRKIIEDTFASVTDYYGFGEICSVAVQCSENNYHIIEPRVFVEEEDFLLNKKLILVTDLENFSMPLIRYRIGDLFDGLNNDKCKCGLIFKYFKKLEGRTSELIKLPNGKHISPVTIFGGTAFRKVQNFNRHQTIWNGKYFVFIFEVNNKFSNNDKNELEAIIKDILKEYDVNFKLKITTNIISTINKFSYFKIDHDVN